MITPELLGFAECRPGAGFGRGRSGRLCSWCRRRNACIAGRGAPWDARLRAFGSAQRSGRRLRGQEQVARSVRDNALPGTKMRGAKESALEGEGQGRQCKDDALSEQGHDAPAVIVGVLPVTRGTCVAMHGSGTVAVQALMKLRARCKHRKSQDKAHRKQCGCPRQQRGSGVHGSGHPAQKVISFSHSSNREERGASVHKSLEPSRGSFRPRPVSDFAVALVPVRPRLIMSCELRKRGLRRVARWWTS
jgi:hypothetical protein